jgi:hypothetical protein
MTNLSIQNDPNIVLPPSVRDIVSKANAFYEESQNEPAPDAPTEQADPSAAQPAQEQPAQTQAPEPQPEPEPPTETDDDKTWRGRFKSMKGRFDQATAQNKQLSEQISNLQQQIVQLRLNQGTTPERIDEEPARSKLITDEEERDYGAEFLNVVGKKAKEELSPEVSLLKRKIEELEGKLAGVGGHMAQNAREKMLSEMDARLPTWRDINFNEDFKAWLALPDTYSGVIRHDMLKAAYAENDTRRVLAFFNGFLAEEAAVAPDQGSSEKDLAAQVVPKIPLEELAAPGRAKTAAASTGPAEKPSFTRAQIAAFYADCATGKYRGKDAERERMEKAIFDAQQDGRIR